MLKTKFVNIGGVKIRTYSSTLVAVNSKPALLFFHGFSFSIDDWEKIGILKVVEEKGYNVVAIDLPAGKASKSDKMDLKDVSDCNSVIEKTLSSVGIAKEKKLVIIGPSMGGSFALAYALENQKRISGLVLVAPALQRVPENSIKSLKNDIPVLLVWGENDDVFPLEEYGQKLQNLFPKARLVTIKGAGHPAYLDQPEEFRRILFDFVGEISNSA